MLTRAEPSEARQRQEARGWSTHPPEGFRQRIVKLWWSSLTGVEIAAEYNLAPITVYVIWSQAKALNQLPKRRRPPQGF
jgi:hypothetical protein